MGKFQTEILTGFKGKVGPVVCARWKGIDYTKVKLAKDNLPNGSPFFIQQNVNHVTQLVKLFLQKLPLYINLF